MIQSVKKFLECEDGAVTVDWVVLTAAVAGLGLAVVAVIISPMSDQSESVSTYLESQPIEDTF